MNTAIRFLISLAAASWVAESCAADDEVPSGFVSMFNGKDFENWKVPEGDNGHWKVLGGVIDYDAKSEAKEKKDLWSVKEYGDFVLRIDWRIKETPFVNPRVPIILPSGEVKKGLDGKPIQMSVPDSDSGIFLRGSSKAQVNIWCWPIGSGEVYGYRNDAKQSAEVRAALTPKLHADKDIGQWNTFEITMKKDRLTVMLNDKLVIDNAQLPEVPERGPIALQHHGAFVNGAWTGPPSLVQFRRIYIKEL